MKKQHREDIDGLNSKHSDEINALRRKHKLELDQMVPKKWYDDGVKFYQKNHKKL